MPKMYPLELWLLKQYCKRYEIDIQQIDDTLTYYENKEHLQRLFLDINPSPGYGPLAVDMSEVRTWGYREDEWAARMAEYLSDHTLENYIANVEAGWTVSTELGEPDDRPILFLLSKYIAQRRD